MLADEIASAIAVVLKGEVNVMMTTLNGSLPVGTKGVVLTDKFDTMEEHINLGLHTQLATWPSVANEDDQFIEFVQLVRVEGVV